MSLLASLPRLLRSKLVMLICLAFLVLVAASPVPGAAGAAGCEPIVMVTSDADRGPGSLRQAILDVCAGGEIGFDLPMPASILLTSGQLTIDKALTINGPGTNWLTISGSGESRILLVGVGGKGVNLNHLRLANGNEYNYGGGILNAGELHLTDTLLENHSVDAVQSSGYGGAIFNQGILFVTDTLIRANSVHTSGLYTAALGGGIYNQNGVLFMYRDTLSQNQVDGGGGPEAAAITNLNGLVTILNSTISGNMAIYDSGALLNLGGVMHVSHSTVANNRVDPIAPGYAILNGEGTLDLRDSIVANNEVAANCAPSLITSLGYNLADDDSCNLNGPGDLSNSNPQLGALKVNDVGLPTHALLTGSPALDAGICTDFDNNPVPNDGRGLPRPVDGPTLPNAADGCDIGAVETQAVDLEPRKRIGEGMPIPGQRVDYVITLTNHGVMTTTTAIVSDTLPSELTFAAPVTLDPPQPDAILAHDAADLPMIGSNLSLVHGQTITLTLPVTINLDVPWGQPITNTVIVNSDEALTPHQTTYIAAACAPALPVTNNADDGPGSLRQAIRFGCPGATIAVDFAQPITITLTSGQLYLNKPLRIVGSGADKVIISGGGENRVFYVGPYQVSLEGMTIRDGEAEIGGGIYNDGGDLRLAFTRVMENEATSALARGGGIFSEAGSLRISDSAIAGNDVQSSQNSGQGGGMYVYAGNVLLSHSTVADNESNLYGGGISASGYVDFHIFNSTISHNEATYSGGIAAGRYAKFLIENSTIAANEGGSGAGIAASLAAITLRNTIIAHNGIGNCTNDGGQYESRGYNLDNDDSCHLTAETDLPNEEPSLLPLGDYGGATAVHALAAGSVAINAGSCFDDGGNFLPDDQRGIPRPQGDNCDIGAYEWVGIALRIVYQYWMNDGSRDQGRYTLLADGSYVDGYSATGLWRFQPTPSPRLLLRYDPGLSCNALSVGYFVSRTELRGWRLCRDGSGAIGYWIGQVTGSEAMLSVPASP